MDTAFPSHAFDKTLDPLDDLDSCTECACRDVLEGTKVLEAEPLPSCECTCHEDADAIAGDIAYCEMKDK